MQVSLIEEPKEFKPFRIEITVESLTEAAQLWVAFNHPTICELLPAVDSTSVREKIRGGLRGFPKYDKWQQLVAKYVRCPVTDEDRREAKVSCLE